jgi:poly-D-alanine transfer protein DltD
MPKLRDILTQEEHAMVYELRTKMLKSETKKESDNYRSEIEAIFDTAKERYFATLNKQSPEKENEKKIRTLSSD